MGTSLIHVSSSGYDVVGVENIPLDRGALIVPYHALLPVDLYAFIGWFFLRTNKMISGSIDRLFWEVPLLRTLFKVRFYLRNLLFFPSLYKILFYDL